MEVRIYTGCIIEMKKNCAIGYICSDQHDPWNQKAISGIAGKLTALGKPLIVIDCIDLVHDEALLPWLYNVTDNPSLEGLIVSATLTDVIKSELALPFMRYLAKKNTVGSGVETNHFPSPAMSIDMVLEEELINFTEGPVQAILISDNESIRLNTIFARAFSRLAARNSSKIVHSCHLELGPSSTPADMIDLKEPLPLLVFTAGKQSLKFTRNRPFPGITQTHCLSADIWEEQKTGMQGFTCVYLDPCMEGAAACESLLSKLKNNPTENPLGQMFHVFHDNTAGTTAGSKKPRTTPASGQQQTPDTVKQKDLRFKTAICHLLKSKTYNHFYETLPGICRTLGYKKCYINKSLVKNTEDCSCVFAMNADMIHISNEQNRIIRANRFWPDDHDPLDPGTPLLVVPTVLGNGFAGTITVPYIQAISGQLDLLRCTIFQVVDHLGHVNLMNARYEKLRQEFHSQAVNSNNIHTPEIKKSGETEVLESLMRSELRYRRFFQEDLTGDFIIGRDLRIIDCNPAFMRMLGFPSFDFALGYDVRSLFPDEDAFRAVAVPFLQQKRLEYFEIELKRLDGKEAHMIANIIGIRDNKSRLRQIWGFLFDNTPRKHLLNQLRQSQKMEALSRMAGGIAHDFNNLLTVINGYSEMIMDELDEDNPVKADVKEIREAGGKAGELTSQLLSFSRRQVLTPKIIDINEVARELDKMLSRMLGARITLEVITGKTLPIMIDRSHLEQIIINLTLNSRDAISGEGRITIRTFTQDLKVSFYEDDELLLPGRYSCLSVSDTGSGIDQETREHMFEPFFTTKEKGKGTGLGLSMVYGLVNQCNGFLHINSGPGKGTEIILYFNPETGEKQREPVPAGHKQQIKGSETILLVEDEPQVREFTSRVLQNKGYTVINAQCGEDALQQMESGGQDIKLVLSDIIMPGISGIKLAEILGKKHPGIPVMLMSGYTDEQLIKERTEKNNNLFIRKPFRSVELMSKVRNALNS